MCIHATLNGELLLRVVCITSRAEQTAAECRAQTAALAPDVRRLSQWAGTRKDHGWKGERAVHSSWLARSGRTPVHYAQLPNEGTAARAAPRLYSETSEEKRRRQKNHEASAEG